MSTEQEYPHFTSTQVPVSCSVCAEDMFYSIEYHDSDHRTWDLDCKNCGSWEASEKQRRRHLWANNDTIYVGSYWGPDD